MVLHFTVSIDTIEKFTSGICKKGDSAEFNWQIGFTVLMERKQELEGGIVVVEWLFSSVNWLILKLCHDLNGMQESAEEGTQFRGPPGKPTSVTKNPVAKATLVDSNLHHCRLAWRPMLVEVMGHLRRLGNGQRSPEACISDETPPEGLNLSFRCRQIWSLGPRSFLLWTLGYNGIHWRLWQLGMLNRALLDSSLAGSGDFADSGSRQVEGTRHQLATTTDTNNLLTLASISCLCNGGFKHSAFGFRIHSNWNVVAKELLTVDLKPNVFF